MKGTATLSADGLSVEFRDNDWKLIKTYQHGDAIEFFDQGGWSPGVVVARQPNQWSIQAGRTSIRIIDFPNRPDGFIARI